MHLGDAPLSHNRDTHFRIDRYTRLLLRTVALLAWYLNTVEHVKLTRESHGDRNERKIWCIGPASTSQTFCLCG
jgi:hypothetical protein